MNKLLSTTMLLALALSVHAQRQVFDMMSRKGDKAGSFTVTDSAGNKSFFKIDEENITAMSDKKSMTETLQAPRPDKKYKDIVGYQLKGGEYTIFFSNSWHTDLSSVSFNFVTNKTEQHLIPLNLSKESYFSSFVYKNKLYFITRLKDATGIRIFTFIRGDQFTSNTITFKNIDTGLTSFYAALSPDDVAPIDASTSSTFKTAAHETKIFVINDIFYVSLDHSDKSTSVIRIDLRNYESAVSVYEQGVKIPAKKYNSSNNSLARNNSTGNFSTSNNSIIYKDKLFQFTSCTSGINLRIRTIPDGTIINEYTATDGGEITFKNSALIQIDSSSFKGEVEKELTTKQFIRKTSNSPSFVSVTEKNNTLLVSLGAIQYTSTYPVTPGGTALIVKDPPTSKTVLYFNTLLSKDTFEHIDEK